MIHMTMISLKGNADWAVPSRTGWISYSIVHKTQSLFKFKRFSFWFLIFHLSFVLSPSKTKSLFHLTAIQSWLHWMSSLSLILFNNISIVSAFIYRISCELSNYYGGSTDTNNRNIETVLVCRNRNECDSDMIAVAYTIHHRHTHGCHLMTDRRMMDDRMIGLPLS